MSNSKLLSLLCCAAFATQANDAAAKQAEVVVVHAKRVRGSVEEFSGFLGIPVLVSHSRSKICAVPIASIKGKGDVDNHLLFDMASPGNEADKHGLTMCGLCSIPLPPNVCRTQDLEDALAVHWPLACYLKLHRSLPLILNTRVRITHFALENPTDVKEPPRVVSVVEYTNAYPDSKLPELVGKITAASRKIAIMCTSWQQGTTLQDIEIKDEGDRKFVSIEGVSYSVLAYFCGSVEELDAEKMNQLCEERRYKLPFKLEEHIDGIHALGKTFQLEEEEEEELQSPPATPKTKASISGFFKRSLSPAALSAKPEQDGQTTPPAETIEVIPDTATASASDQNGQAIQTSNPRSSRVRNFSRGTLGAARRGASAAGSLLLPGRSRTPPRAEDDAPAEPKSEAPVATIAEISTIVQDSLPEGSPMSEVPAGSPVVVSPAGNLGDFALSSVGSLPQTSPDATPASADFPAVDETLKALGASTPTVEKETAQIAIEQEKK